MHWPQCDQVWKIYKSLEIFWSLIKYLENIETNYGLNKYASGRIFIAVNGQILPLCQSISTSPSIYYYLSINLSLPLHQSITTSPSICYYLSTNLSLTLYQSIYASLSIYLSINLFLPLCESIPTSLSIFFYLSISPSLPLYQSISTSLSIYFYLAINLSLPLSQYLYQSISMCSSSLCDQSCETSRKIKCLERRSFVKFKAFQELTRRRSRYEQRTLSHPGTDFPL